MRIWLLILLLLPVRSLIAEGALEKAIFAGGCFWCVEAAYQEVPGVEAAVSGFTGGSLPNPTYSGNHQGHWEAVQLTFDPEVISYESLLAIFWRNIDPFDAGGQFCDRGHSYKSAIFVLDEAQRQLAEASRQKVIEQFPSEQVVTGIREATRFWPVESYHQDYYVKNPIRYRFYRAGCGRDQRLETIWGEAADH